jgi:predicted secreted protein
VIEDLNILATSDIVSDLNTLATTDIVSDINTLATSDIVSDLNTLATSDIVSDINTLATSDIVSDLNTLATSDFVSDLNTIATTTNVNNIATVAGANSNITTVATNISGVNSFAERYRVASSDPSSSLDEGDLAYNSTSNTLKYYNGSAWVGISPGIASLAADGSPQLGADLDMNGQDIVTTSNADIDLAPNGTGRVVVKGNTNQGSIVLNCENNSHGITIQSAPHSAGATYTVKLPNSLGLTSASAFVTSDANGVVGFDNGTTEESTVVSSSSNAATINLRDGNVFTHTLSENVTYTFSNPAASGRASAFILKVVQDSSARTITWPSSVDWAAATAPTITATNAGVDVFAFITVDGGTNYYGFTLGQAMG